MPSLQIGTITQEVLVTAEAPPLATADARLGQTIRNEVYTALPLVMNTGGPRDPTAFMFIMPGVQSIGRWGNVMGGQDFTTDMYIEGHSDHQRRGPGRRPEPVVRHLGRGDRSVSGGNERHRGDVQRAGRIQLRRQVGDQHVPRRRGSSSSGTRRSTRRRTSRAPSRTTTSTNTAVRSAAPSAGTGCSSSSPTTDTATGVRRPRH